MGKIIFSLIRLACMLPFIQNIYCLPSSKLFHFGTGVGDFELPSGDDGDPQKIALNYRLICFGSRYDSLYVSNVQS